MKKKIFIAGALGLVLLSFILYFFHYTTTESDNLYLSVIDQDSNGWVITGSENGKEGPIDGTEAINYQGTVFMHRTIDEDWINYSRINLDGGRAVLVFIDNKLVFNNYPTDKTEPGEIPSVQKPVDQPFSLVLTMNPAWVGKTVTVVTKLYENEPCGSISFDLISDHVMMLQHEAWVNQKAIPGSIFGVLAMLLLGLFLYEFSSRKKGYSLLFLAVAALLQMLSYMSVLNEYPFPVIDMGLAMVMYFLFPLLYLGTKLTKSKKRYFIAIICSWSIYFILYLMTYVWHLPLPYWFDKVDLLCFVLLGIMLYYSFKERKINPFFQHFLSLLLAFAIGFLLLFIITGILKMPINQTILIYFYEAYALYTRPLLFWIFNSILVVSFILAVWDLLQDRVQAAKQMEFMRNEQSILNIQVDAAKGQLESLRVANEQTLIYRHDMRHHFSLLSAYIKDGDMKKANDYIQSAVSNIDAITPVRYCENETINLILSSFDMKAKAMNITLSKHLELTGNLHLPDTELCALLSNSIENALNAVTQLEDKELQIVKISCTIEHDNLLLMIENPYAGKVEMKHNIPISKHDNHGFGCHSIAAIVDRRNGHYIFNAEDGVFTLQIVLPLN